VEQDFQLEALEDLCLYWLVERDFTRSTLWGKITT